MRVVTLDQGSPEWLLWRTKGLGASDAPIIMGVSPWCDPITLLNQKVARWFHSERHSNKTKNARMMRGILMEPEARQAYIDQTGNYVEPLCAIHDCLDWMRASYDGASPDRKILVEIKCINADDHQTALGGCVPAKYWPQVQHQLAVAGEGTTLHYFSYSKSSRFSKADQSPPPILVRPHDPYQTELLAREQDFWEKVLKAIRLKEKGK